MILGALVIYFVFYFTHGRYLMKNVVRADPNRETPAHRLFDGTDYVPANKYVLYGHHFASIAGAGPIIGPAVALGWGWLPAVLWVWFGNVFIGVVHDYLALMASVRYDGRTIGWISGKLFSRKAMFAFNSYIWFSLLLVVAAFSFVISSLFVSTPGGGVAAMSLILLAVIVGFLMYKTNLSFTWSTVIAIIFIILAVWLGFYGQNHGWLSSLTMHHWEIILFFYIIIAASLPVWVLLQPRDYMNAYILWASLAIGGGAIIIGALRGVATLEWPSYTSWSAHVVGGKASPFWPTVPLVIACGALSGFHSLVGSGTSSKQLDNELHGLLVGYGGMLTEGFLSTMVIASMAGFGFLALTDPTIADKLAANSNVKAVISAAGASSYADFINKLHDPSFFGQWYAVFANKSKWVVIPWSYAYAVKTSLGLSSEKLQPLAVFATLWITGFALTSLDTATRLGRYAWQELMEPLKGRTPGAYKVLANKWFASALLAALGIALAWGKDILLLWPAFAGMNQLLSSLALMTVSIWVWKVQKASGLGKGLVVAPAVFMWITVTIALIWYLAVVSIPGMLKGDARSIAVSIITLIGLGLDIYLFAEWITALRRPAPEELAAAA